MSLSRLQAPYDLMVKASDDLREYMGKPRRDRETNHEVARLRRSIARIARSFKLLDAEHLDITGYHYAAYKPESGRSYKKGEEECED